MCLWLVATAALAQTAPAPAPAPAAPAPALDEAEVSLIIGEFLKPDITVIISRENLNKAYDLQLDESFLDKVIQSVKQPPF
jgi:hypothetical protein